MLLVSRHIQTDVIMILLEDGDPPASVHSFLRGLIFPETLQHTAAFRRDNRKASP